MTLTRSHVHEEDFYDGDHRCRPHRATHMVVAIESNNDSNDHVGHRHRRVCGTVGCGRCGSRTTPAVTASLTRCLAVAMSRSARSATCSRQAAWVHNALVEPSSRTLAARVGDHINDVLTRPQQLLGQRACPAPQRTPPPKSARRRPGGCGRRHHGAGSALMHSVVLATEMRRQLTREGSGHPRLPPTRPPRTNGACRPPYPSLLRKDRDLRLYDRCSLPDPMRCCEPRHRRVGSAH